MNWRKMFHVMSYTLTLLNVLTELAMKYYFKRSKRPEYPEILADGYMNFSKTGFNVVKSGLA